MHIYTKNGIDYPSVTTILNCLGNEAITKWANHLGFMHKDYETVLNESAEFGTKVHSVLQHVVDPRVTINVTYKNNIEMLEIHNIEERFKKFIEAYQYKTIYTEHTIISPTLGYAGTMDWVAEFFMKYKMLLDFKTSKAVRFHQLLQLGGYSNLLKTEEGLDVDGAAIILANKKLCSMYVLNHDMLTRYGEAFNTLAMYYNSAANLEMQPDVSFFPELTNP